MGTLVSHTAHQLATHHIGSEDALQGTTGVLSQQQVCCCSGGINTVISAAGPLECWPLPVLAVPESGWVST